MAFDRKYVLIAMETNQILAFFNDYNDAKEYLDQMNTRYAHKYSSIRIFKEVK